MRNQEPLGVLIPNSIWESLIEDIEALSSSNYIKAISESRKSKRTYSSDEVKDMLGI
jgi:PHD/YefM family antitoxin component YafN of YafNO toxin-antitoxin module